MIDALESIDTLFVERGNEKAKANKAKATEAYKAIGDRVPERDARGRPLRDPLRKDVLSSTDVCARQLAGLSIPTHDSRYSRVLQV